MTKKSLVGFASLTLALASVLSLPSCQDKAQKSAPATAAEVQATGLSIALVRMDSVTSQYKYAQEVKAALEKDAQEHQMRLQSKGAALQKAAADFGAQLSQQLAMKQQLMLEDMMKELRAQLKEYNKDGRYKLVLTQVGDNVLYAEEALDITDDFIKYLNEHYTTGKATAAKADSTSKK